MKDTEIIEILRNKLSVPVGRHLYGILGSYHKLALFAQKMREARTPDGKPFGDPINVNRGILSSIPDEEFRRLAQDEAIRPEPVAKHIAMAFEKLLRSRLKGGGLIILEHLEMIFTYNVELNTLRTLAADDKRVILLLPGKRSGGNVLMFPDYHENDISYSLPTNLIAADHLWEIGE